MQEVRTDYKGLFKWLRPHEHSVQSGLKLVVPQTQQKPGSHEFFRVLQVRAGFSAGVGWLTGSTGEPESFKRPSQLQSIWRISCKLTSR